MLGPMNFTLSDGTVVTIRPDSWNYLGPEVKKKDWYECVLVLAGGTSITVRGTHDRTLMCLMGLDPACYPKWWPPRP